MKIGKFLGVVICMGLLSSGLISVYGSGTELTGPEEGKSVNAKQDYWIFGMLGNQTAPLLSMNKQLFDSLIRDGIRAVDTAGKLYEVISFEFGFSERNLYEDSIGNLMTMNDYYSFPCTGDTLRSSYRSQVLEKVKPFDTAYIDQIKVLLPELNKVGAAKSFRIVFTR